MGQFRREWLFHLDEDFKIDEGHQLFISRCYSKLKAQWETIFNRRI